jgi:SWI/SNF-related matrix-associated actin-dependent regulator 1 of chromatin subfamily A
VARNPKAAYIPDERAWKVSLEDKWYVDKMGEWAVSARICSRVQRSVSSRAVTDYTIPDLPKLTVPHGLLLVAWTLHRVGDPLG